MIKLTKMIKALLGLTLKGASNFSLMNLVSMIVRSATKQIIATLAAHFMKSKSTSQRPQYLQIFLRGILAYALLRLTKRSRIINIAAISAISSLLLSILKSRNDHGSPKHHGQKDQVIDIDEFTVVDEND
jgi:hypothetical protein